MAPRERVSRDVHAARLRDGRDRIFAHQERRAHDGDEPLNLPARGRGVLAGGYAFAMGGVAGWAPLGPTTAAHSEFGFHIGERFFGLLGTSKSALASVGHDP